MVLPQKGSSRQVDIVCANHDVWRMHSRRAGKGTRCPFYHFIASSPSPQTRSEASRRPQVAEPLAYVRPHPPTLSQCVLLYEIA
jgi:hypothetical protein